MKPISIVLDELRMPKSDEYHRGKSWEYCYVFFRGHKEICDDEKLLDQAALHLGFYLASWGMFRNSFLMQADYKYYVPIIKILTKADDRLWTSDPWQNQPLNAQWETNLKLLFELVEHLRNTIEREKNRIYTEPGTKEVGGTTNTLVTKIIMGTMGCVPAYDTYFRSGLSKILTEKGLKRRGITHFNEKSFEDLLDLSNEQWLREIYTASVPIGDTGLKYPPMKILDLYFWLHGFNKDW